MSVGRLLASLLTAARAWAPTGDSSTDRCGTESLPDGVLRVGADGRIETVTPLAEAVLGAEMPLVGTPVDDHLPEPVEGSVFERRIEGEERWFEPQLLDADGAGRWILLTEVTERVGCERRLARYETAVEHVERPLAIVDPTGAFEAVSPAFAELVGASRSELLGDEAAQYVHDYAGAPEADDGAGAEDEAGADGAELTGSEATASEVTGSEVTLLDRDGARLSVDAHVRPRRSDGRPAGTVVVADCPARSAAFAQYETIMEILPDPVYATDEGGRLTFVNRAFEEQFGIDREAVSTSSIHFSAVTTQAGAQAVADTLRELVADDDSDARRTVESVGVTDDGRTLAVENSLAVLSADSEFDGAVGVLRDVTERKRREEVFSVMNRTLRHNLRTNVNVIAGYAELLEGDVDEATEDHLRTIRESADWLAKLGDTLRTLQTTIDDSLREEGVTDVETVADSVVSEARERYPAADIECTVAARGAVAGGEALRIALGNVVENAVVHDDSDVPSIDVWVTDAPREGWIELSVADEGPGIPPEERAVVLGEAEPTQLTHGSGIGLWTTSWIVQVLDGEIEIQENEPRGSVVSLRLRRVDRR